MILSASLVLTLALHLPKLCKHLARTNVTCATEISARIALDRTSVTTSLPELEYLLLNLTAQANQLARYKMAEADVSVYVLSATRATAFVPPTESTCLFVQYDELFEEIDGYL